MSIMCKRGDNVNTFPFGNYGLGNFLLGVLLIQGCSCPRNHLLQLHATSVADRLKSVLPLSSLRETSALHGTKRSPSGQRVDDQDYINGVHLTLVHPLSRVATRWESLGCELPAVLSRQYPPASFITAGPDLPVLLELHKRAVRDCAKKVHLYCGMLDRIIFRL